MKKRKKKCFKHNVEDCPACGQARPMTKHHVKPRRWFGRENNETTVKLCRDCHDEVERRIYHAEGGHKNKLSEEQYWAILLKFMAGGIILFFIFKIFFLKI